MQERQLKANSWVGLANKNIKQVLYQGGLPAH